MVYPLLEEGTAAASRPTVPMFPQDDRHTSGTSLLDKKNEFNILEKLKQLRDQKKYCDVVLEVRGAKLEAHKNVLASWSPYFAAKLFPNETKVSRDYLTVNYDNSEVFADLLDFMYNGYVAPRETNFLQLLHLAVSFQIETLKNYCEEFLRCNLHLGNFVSTYFLSRKFRLDSLEEYIVGFLQLNLSDAVKQGEFLSLKAEKFNTFLSMGWMEKIKPEIKLFLIISWVGYDVQEREKFLVLLLGHIDWSTVANDFLLEINRTENFFTSHESSLYLLLQTLFSAGIPLGPYTDVFPLLRKTHLKILDNVVHSGLLQIETEEFRPVTINMKPRPAFREANMNTLKSSIRSNTVDIAVNTDVNSLHFEENVEPVSNTVIIDVPLEDKTSVYGQDVNERFDSFGKFIESEIHEIKQKEKEKQIKEKFGMKNSMNAEFTEIPEIKIKSPALSDLNKAKEEKVLKTQKRRSTRAKKVTSYKDLVEREEADQIEVLEVNTNTKELNSKLMEEELYDEADDTENEYKPSKADKESEDDASEDDDDDTENTLKTRDAILVQIKANKTGKGMKKTRAKRSKPGKSIMCTVEGCAYITKFENRMSKHIKSAHESTFDLRCNLCPFVSKEVRKYNTHMKQHFPGPPYMCDYPRCDFAAAKVAQMLAHRVSHTDERPFTCECGQSFRTNNTLIAHKKVHLGKKTYACPECGTTFATKNTMNQHMVTHSNVRPYLCDLCGFATKFQSHLIAHKRIHTGNVFKCQFPKCEYSTPKRCQLKSHMRAHLGIRAHVCQTCGKSFVERSHMIRHEKLHKSEKIACEHCDYKTTRKDKLKEHVYKHHTGYTASPAKTKKAKTVNTSKSKKTGFEIHKTGKTESLNDITTPMLVKWDHGGYSMTDRNNSENGQLENSTHLIDTDGFCVLREQLTTSEPVTQILSVDQMNSSQIGVTKVIQEDDLETENHSTLTSVQAVMATSDNGEAGGSSQLSGGTMVVNASNMSGLSLVGSPGHTDHVVTSGLETDQGSHTYTIIQPAPGTVPQNVQDYGGLGAFMALF